MKFGFVKREDASETVLTIMIWAVLTVLGTRLWLKYIVSYLIIGRGNWHIAHVVWGGLFMFIGAILQMTFYGEKIKKSSTIIFGIGLGWFIDEVGKFISMDNNYFFQPAVMLIYIFFIVLFLIYRYLEKINSEDPKTMLYQVINQLEDVAEGDFEVKEKNKILDNLSLVANNSSEPNKTFAMELRKLIVKTPVIVDKPDGLSKMFWKKIKTFSYHKIFRKKFVLLILLLLSFGYMISSTADMIFIWSMVKDRDLNLSVIKAILDIATAAMFAIGVYWVIRKKRRRGISFFQYGLLIFILLTSVIRFYFEQFIALQGLVVTMVIYMGLERFKKELKN